ncbi:MAG: hypothetical protein VW547_05475 [Alphaproteobacteria bacterium]
MTRYFAQTWAEPHGHPPEACDGTMRCEECHGDGAWGPGDYCPRCRGSGTTSCDCETCDHGVHIEDECKECAEEYRAQEEIEE